MMLPAYALRVYDTFELASLVCASPFRYFSDAPVPCHYHFAGPPRRLLEVGRVHRQNLPARDGLPEQTDAPHVRKIAPQALVMLGCCCQPHTVVARLACFVAQDEHNFAACVHRHAAEQRPGSEIDRGKRIQHELVGDPLPARESEERIVCCGLSRLTNHGHWFLLWLALIQGDEPLLDESLQDCLSGLDLSHVVKKG